MTRNDLVKALLDTAVDDVSNRFSDYLYNPLDLVIRDGHTNYFLAGVCRNHKNGLN